MNKQKMSWDEFFERLEKLGIDKPENVVFGIPRGGLCASAFLSFATITHDPEFATILFDDIIDSGKTKEKWAKLYPNTPFVGLVDKNREEDKDISWIEFPWETTKEDDFEDCLVRILEHLNTPVTDENIKNLLGIITYGLSKTLS